MNNISNKEKLIALVESLSRPGAKEVAELIRNSRFASVYGGASHHKYHGSLVDHSLEVYENMKAKAAGLDIDEESIIICSIFHDLGKLRGQKKHPSHSLAILDECGFMLTKEERMAIATHHRSEGFLKLHSLQSLLKRSDMLSTGEWKESHRKNNTTLSKRIKNSALKLISKL